MTQSRTHTCGELRLANAGETVTLVGWMENVRVVGNNFAFIVLRDFYGTTQIVVETEKIMNAQKARGAMLDSGTFTQRIKALVPILIPLFISAFRRADELAMAMECRCYHGGEGRTRMKQMKLHGRDLISGVATAAVFAGVILLNKYVNLLPTIW